jgi:hypothetical protein
MSRRGIVGLMGLLTLAGAGWWLWHSAHRISPRERWSSASAGPTVSQISPASGALRPATPQEVIAATPAGILHFADALNGPNQTTRDDVQLLASLLQLYRRTTQGLNPVGDNAEITAALTGKNRLAYAFISPAHPAINRQGELCDRWGTPYFFHQISGTVMQVRSAGPDRQQWTADDIAAGP